MARNTDDLILRGLTHAPLTTKGSNLTADDFDNNNINIYEDIVSLSQTLGVDAYDSGTTYDDTVNQFATYGNQLWQWVNASPGSAVTPVDGIYWQSVFPAILAHRKNSDTILAEGSSDEVTAAEIRAYIDGGLTTTTNLDITTKTANTFTITSSTGSDVVAPEATQTYAGLLGANDKVKLDQLSGANTGDQTLGSLGAEATANKATDFSTVNDILFPTVQAVETRVQEAINEVSSSTVIVSEYINDSKASVGGGFVDFTTGTITIPNIEDGESFKLTATFLNSVAPVSNGFGMYFYFNNQSYIHPTVSTPTYANSFLKFPTAEYRMKVEITVNKIDSTEVYLIVDTTTTTLLGVPTKRYAFYGADSITLDDVTNLVVQAYVSAGGTITLEYLDVRINKL